MKLFEVYSLLPIEPVRAEGSWLWDKDGNRYLDFYGGHAVISIGHNHPKYQQAIKNQLDKISFYSNSVLNSIQEELAEKLGRLSGYEDYSLFLCNSGAEANENALKIASFVSGRKKIVALKNAFHGRTSGAVAATDNPKIVAPVNAGHEVVFVGLNDLISLEQAVDDQTAAILIEGIQGVGGIYEPNNAFFQKAAELATKHQCLLILDEIQSGYGRTGKFFAHQFSGIKPHLITTAKGMGNGFPIGGVLISPEIKPWSGMLGTTFGGNHLACAAAVAVLDIIKEENLIENAANMGTVLSSAIGELIAPATLRGKGLMLGFDTPAHAPTLRQNLIKKHRIFTGEAKPNVIRLLPPLNIGSTEIEILIEALRMELSANQPQ
ncbi:MAG: aspartate aminotransferase family protein [Bacteroidetes bacterium]|nr:aspartate aminotransferase family protein [Bacteroidota bacterium]